MTLLAPRCLLHSPIQLATSQLQIPASITRQAFLPMALLTDLRKVILELPFMLNPALKLDWKVQGKLIIAQLTEVPQLQGVL